MDISILLARVLGIYLIIVCAVILLKRSSFERVVRSFTSTSNEALIIFAGSIHLLLGLVLVAVHNIWSSDWRVIITMLGWLTIIKGLTRLFFFDQVIKLASRLRPPFMLTIGIIFLLIGLYLAVKGFASPLPLS